MTTSFTPFALEQYQSLHERNVEYNLADSSVQCLTTREWLSADDVIALLDTGLFYPEVNGTHELRSRIAALYPQARPEQVLVTVGAAQANALVCATLLRPRDEVIVMSPGYMQVRGLALNAGCVVYDVPLIPEETGWRLDVDRLDALISPRTRLVAVVNPNNPTGTILGAHEMQRIVAACARVGAWLHADEVYRGTEHDGHETPGFWGMYDRLICTSSLSKAYGLAGLRIGWVLAAVPTIEEIWRRHEYAVIAAAAPSMTLATLALEPARRALLLARQRELTLAGWQVLHDWLPAQHDRFSVRPAAATAIAFVRYHLPILSLDLTERVRREASLLVAPGVMLGSEQHLRITLGYAPDKIRAALDRLGTIAARVEIENG